MLDFALDSLKKATIHMCGESRWVKRHTQIFEREGALYVIGSCHNHLLHSSPNPSNIHVRFGRIEDKPGKIGKLLETIINSFDRWVVASSKNEKIISNDKVRELDSTTLGVITEASTTRNRP
ncbi:hypothetical protein RND81_08G096300 [Saponaria officinalis]|uniref:Uncharacterized protein n=1 Tax=Saponaria officinalis TaxID=3572 RepID=A0AAW1J5H0_SAPOF